MREDPGGRHQCGIGLDGAELVEAGAQIRRRHLFTTCKTKKVMSLQVAFREHKALTRNLIKITRAVRFELEERLRRKAQLFMADEGDFGELMRLTTRVKIHRNFDKLLTTFNRQQTDAFVLQRLSRTIPLYLAQLKRAKSRCGIMVAYYIKLGNTALLMTKRLDIMNRCVQ